MQIQQIQFSCWKEQLCMNPRSVLHCMHLNDAAARLQQQERVMLSDGEHFCYTTLVEK